MRLLPELSDVGNVASVVGLIISVWVLINTYKLKSEFRVFTGIPRLLNKLSENASKLLKLLRKFTTEHHFIMAELSRIEANVESVKEKDRKTEIAVQRVQAAVRVFRETPTDIDKLWEVHTQLLGLIEKIKNTQADRLEER